MKNKKIKVIDLGAVPFAKIYEFETIEEANAFLATHKYAKIKEQPHKTINLCPRFSRD